MNKKSCACFEIVGDNPACPTHAADCINCGFRFIMGRNGIETPRGDMCDVCAGVVRNEHGLVIDMDETVRSAAA